MSDNEARDRDLPGDAAFTPAPEVVTDAAGRLVSVIPVSLAKQRAIHHNQLRYVELVKLRAGRPNLYNETRYR